MGAVIIFGFGTEKAGGSDGSCEKTAENEKLEKQDGSWGIGKRPGAFVLKVAPVISWRAFEK